MVGPELRLARLHHLHKQLLRLIPPPFVIIYPAERSSYKTLISFQLLNSTIILAKSREMHNQISTELKPLLLYNLKARYQNRYHIPPPPSSILLVLHRQSLHQTIYSDLKPLSL